MKEKIYTIPVTDAFKVDCECSLCILEKKLEDEYVDYILGPSLMEVDGRNETNEKGFCRHHFELLYNKQFNRHGLGLIIDTYLVGINKKYKDPFHQKLGEIKKDADASFIKGISNKVSSKKTESEKLIEHFLKLLSEDENKCTICSKLEYTMDRYIDVVLYLWLEEEDFRKLFNAKKGFCIKHFKSLLMGAQKYLSAREKAFFLLDLMYMQIPHMDRIQEEINWFTKKFDYRNNDAPWGNSKDAVPRSIGKIVGQSDLK